MRRASMVVVGLLWLARPASAETLDSILARYLKAVGGAPRIAAVQTLRRTGRVIGAGGVEFPVLLESKRPWSVREDVTRQGLTGVHAYDGKAGWRIQPWQGKKDVEPIPEEELKALIEDADFDGPLVRSKEKGLRLEYLGTGDVEGTSVHRIRVTDPKGPVFVYSLDRESCVPIKIDTRRTIRGAEREYETFLGDYKPVAGWVLPFWIDRHVKGSEEGQQTVYDSIEANVPIADSRFTKPPATGAPVPRP